MAYAIIHEKLDEETAYRFASSSYVKLETHPDNDGTYTVMVDTTKEGTEPQRFPFGHRCKETDDILGIKNAWIRPDGAVYFLYPWGHDPFAAGIMRTSAQALERAGWAHYSNGKVVNWGSQFKLTSAQKESMYYITGEDHYLSPCGKS